MLNQPMFPEQKLGHLYFSWQIFSFIETRLDPVVQLTSNFKAKQMKCCPPYPMASLLSSHHIQYYIQIDQVHLLLHSLLNTKQYNSSVNKNKYQ